MQHTPLCTNRWWGKDEPFAKRRCWPGFLVTVWKPCLVGAYQHHLAFFFFFFFFFFRRCGGCDIIVMDHFLLAGKYMTILYLVRSWSNFLPICCYYCRKSYSCCIVKKLIFFYLLFIVVFWFFFFSSHQKKKEIEHHGHISAWDPLSDLMDVLESKWPLASVPKPLWAILR